MNKDNILGLSMGTWGRVLRLEGGLTVFLPTKKAIANARVLNVLEDNSITVHWDSNWNLDGDFRTELMRFDDNLVLDTGDVEKRNKVRRDNGLLEIE